MEIGTEISKKIRTAIKAKLVELGAYVDDELPDYIMVMVANKKNQSQITEDLNLFLGANTTIFTEWLNQLLIKLQSITTDPTPAAVVPATPAVTVSEQGQPSVAPPVKAEVAKPAVECKVTTVTAQKEAVSVPPTAPVKAPKVVEDIKITSDNIADFDDDELQDDHNDKEEVVPPANTRGRHSPPNTRTITVHPTSSVPAEPTKRKSLEHTPAENKYVANKDTASSDKKRKVPGSAIGAVLKHDVYDDDEYDPYNPFVGNVASVIRVSERKSSIPHSMQASKSLLFKAMNEAHQSIKLASTRKPDRGGSPGVKRSWVSSRFLSSHRPPLTSTVRKPSRSSRDISRDISPLRSRSRSPQQYSRLASPQRYRRDDRPRRREDRKEKEEEEDESRIDDSVVSPRQLNDSRQVECGADDSDMSLDNQLTTSLVATGLGLVNADVSLNSTAPTFVVTLDGADSHLPPSSLDVTEDMDCDEDTWHDTSSLTTEDDGRLVGKVKPQQIMSSSSIAEEDEREFTEDDGSNKRLKKCTFWPHCRNGDNCAFHHPSIPCRNFKTCAFGEKCLYIHPTCKFNANCTRPNCPYAHTGKQAVVQPVRVPTYEPRIHPIKKGGKPSETICQFFPKCTNMNCPYKHPKPCRYGIGCRNRSTGCSFSHPELPSRQQLRWAASPNQSPLQTTAI